MRDVRPNSLPQMYAMMSFTMTAPDAITNLEDVVHERGYDGRGGGGLGGVRYEFAGQR